MSLDTLPLAIAAHLATRRHRRDTKRGIRSDHAILRWPDQLRATPTNVTNRRRKASRRKEEQ